MKILTSIKQPAFVTFLLKVGLTRMCGFILLIGALGFQQTANAGIVRIVISSVQSPTFDGRMFASAGAYEKLVGKAYGEIDPRLPQNALITDIKMAPVNAKGMVEYSMDIYILKPVDAAKGNHKLFVEVNNRGSKLFGGFNNSGGGNDPTTAADGGEAFLMNLGYSMAWCGWDVSVVPGNQRLTITVPVARHPDGSPVEGPSYEYIVFDNQQSVSYTLAYPSAGMAKDDAKLTVRAGLSDSPLVIPASGWEYINDKAIRLLPAGTAFRQGSIYEFSYRAKDPVVAGIGLAATRDFVSFLRYATADASGFKNPLSSDLQYAFSFAVSQPARYLNDFQTLGFNTDENGKRVFDGMENWLGGGSGAGINFRFAQTSRTERNRQNHLYPEAIFPFAYPSLFDSFNARNSGRMSRCSLSNNCPKVLEINSSNEYWVKAASLLHSDLEGNDLPDPDNVRFYLVSGMQHGSGNADSKGICQQFQNPTNAEPLLRALFLALDDWVTKGIAPPASRVPRRSEGTAVFAIPRPGLQTGIVPKKDLGWPDIPGVTYNGIITTRYFPDFGDSLNDGILGRLPPGIAGRHIYPNFVSKVDRDGNEIAGIRLPPVSVPVATTTGWALRRAGYGENEGCEAAGQNIPFKNYRTERLTSHDPRLSIQERYHTHAGYVKAVGEQAHNLADERFLLKEDAEKYIIAAEESSVLK